MLSDTEIVNCFNKLRKEFYYPLVRINIIKGDNSSIYFSEGCINIGRDCCYNQKSTECFIAHELGHTFYAPCSLRDLVEVVNAVRKAEENCNPKILSLSNNFLYDEIVDYNIFKRGYDINEMLKTVKKRKDKTFQLVLANHYNITKSRKIKKKLDEKTLNLSKKLMKISKSRKSLNQKAIEHYKIIKDYFNDVSESEIQEDLKNVFGYPVYEQLNQNLKEVLNELSDIQNFEDFKQVVKDLNIQTDEKELEFEYYLANAKNFLRFQVNKKKEIQTLSEKENTENWRSDENAELLNIEATLLNEGVIIPDFNTLKTVEEIGLIENKNEKKNIILILDCSGSMLKTTSLISAFSLIETCKQKNYAVGVVLFEVNVHYKSKPTRNYYQLEREVYEKYEVKGEGTQLTQAVEQALQISDENSFFIIVSDFQTYPYNDAKIAYDQIKNKDKHLIIVNEKKYSHKIQDWLLKEENKTIIQTQEDLKKVIIQNI